MTSMPVGLVLMWHNDVVPDGWLACDGQAIPAQYTQLISLVGANTPNLINRAVKPSTTSRQTVSNSATLAGEVTYTISLSTNAADNTIGVSGSTNSAGNHSHSNSYSSNAARYPDAQGHSHGSGGYTHRNISGGAAEVGSNIQNDPHGHGVGNTNGSQSTGDHTHTLSGGLDSDHSHSYSVSGTGTVSATGAKTAAPSIQTLFVIKHD